MDLAKNLKIDSVCRLQLPPVVALGPHHTVRQAVALMQEQRIGCLLVCQNQTVLGVFTERDLLKRVVGCNKPLTTLLQDCMTPRPVTVQEREPIGVALRRMQEGGYRHLPVVDCQGQPVGVLSVKRIVRYLVEHFPQTVYNQPPDPGVVQKDRDGA
jgi:CBS domain-containing protein